MQSDSCWAAGPEVWREFTQLHPELCYREGRQQFHNFLRHHRDALVRCDALRRAKGKFWIAHRARFFFAAFELATTALPPEGFSFAEKNLPGCSSNEPPRGRSQ